MRPRILHSFHLSFGCSPRARQIFLFTLKLIAPKYRRYYNRNRCSHFLLLSYLPPLPQGAIDAKKRFCNKYFQYLMSRWHRPQAIPHPNRVATWSLLPKSHKFSLPLFLSAPWICIALLHVLSLWSNYRELLSLLFGTWPTVLSFFLKERRGAMNTIFINLQRCFALR